MMEITSYHQLGKFVVWFQQIEDLVNAILGLLAKADQEMIRILINELEFSQRIKTMDVMFCRFMDVRLGTDENEKKEFHSLVVELGKLGERRNDLVHSNYTDWRDVNGALGLLRSNSKLRGSKGIREESEEELLPEAFNKDLERLKIAIQRIERFRLKVIDMVYPDASS